MSCVTYTCPCGYAFAPTRLEQRAFRPTCPRCGRERMDVEFDEDKYDRDRLKRLSTERRYEDQ